MRGLLSETVNHKLSAEGIILWVPTLMAALDNVANFVQVRTSTSYGAATTEIVLAQVARYLVG